MRQQQQLWSNFIAVGQVLNGQHSISTNYSLRKEVNPQEKKTGRAGVTRLCECFSTETGLQDPQQSSRKQGISSNTTDTKRSKNANTTLYAAITKQRFTLNDRYSTQPAVQAV